MKAVVIDRYGSREQLKLREVEKPVAVGSEVVLRVHASSVNPLDCKLRSGSLRYVWPVRFPFTPGFDVAGVVEAAGPTAHRWKPGDRVYAGLRRGGCHAEFVVVDESLLAPIPEAISFEEAAVLPIAALTALQALRLKRDLQAGQRILINGASGGVGCFAVQLASAMRCHVTAVASPFKLEFARKLGADQVYDYKLINVLSVNLSYDIIFDVAGNLSFPACSRRLSPGGIYITTQPGMSSLVWQTFASSARVFGYRKRCSWIMVHPNGRDLEFLNLLIAEKKLKPIIERSFRLEAIRDAHGHIEAGHARGKISVQVSSR